MTKGDDVTVMQVDTAVGEVRSRTGPGDGPDDGSDEVRSGPLEDGPGHASRVADQWLDGVLASVGAARDRAVRDAARLDDGQLERALVATEAVRRAVDGLELVLVAEVGRRGEERGPDGQYREVRLPAGEVAEMAPDAVAVAIGTGPTEAGRRCAVASRAATDLAALAELVAEGRLGRRALEQVHKHTRDTTPETTQAIVEHLLGARRGAPGSIRIIDMEPHEVAKTCRRLITRLEPELMQARADANRASRLDVRTEAGPVGTTWLTAVLPSEIGAAIKAAVDAAGQRWRADDPDMPIGTARAMGLADLVLCGSEVTAEVRLGVPVIASAVSRLTFAPVDDPECPICSGEEDPVAGLLEEGITYDRVDHERVRIVSGEGADQVDVLAEEWMSDDVTTQVRVGCGCTCTTDACHHGEDSTGGGGHPCTCRTGGGRWVSGTTIPGVGYVPPDVVAAIVRRLDTRVGRALIDARTGTLLETSTSAYAIPRAQREFVATRDGVCRMWGCERPVQSRRLGWAADVDHATPWPHGGTSPANLSDLCRHHHRVKHSTRWSHRLREDGSTEWITPGGVVALTFPVHAVDEGEESSSPPVGTSDLDNASSPPTGTNEADSPSSPPSDADSLLSPPTGTNGPDSVSSLLVGTNEAEEAADSPPPF